MGSGATAAVLVLWAAASSLVFFDFDFLVFFWRALTSVAIGFPLSGGPMKFNACRTASLRLNGGAPGRIVLTLGDAEAVNPDEPWRGPRSRGKAVLTGVLGLNTLVNPFRIGGLANVATRYRDVLILANPESAMQSGFSLSV